MKNNKRNNGEILEGLKSFYHEEIKNERAARVEVAETAAAMDSRMILLQDLEELHPELRPFLKDAKYSLRSEIVLETTKKLPYISWEDTQILRGRLEQEKPLEILTFEELASVLRPYSKEDWLTK